MIFLDWGVAFQRQNVFKITLKWHRRWNPSMYFPFAIKIGPKTRCGHCGFILDRFSEVEVWFHFGSLFRDWGLYINRVQGAGALGPTVSSISGPGLPRLTRDAFWSIWAGFLATPMICCFSLTFSIDFGSLQECTRPTKSLPRRPKWSQDGAKLASKSDPKSISWLARKCK